jgi:hypothetical protein
LVIDRILSSALTGKVGLACYEIECAVMRAAKAMLDQKLVDRTRQPRVTEKEQLDAAPDLVLPQEEWRRSWRECLNRGRRWDSHIDVS